MPDSQGYINVKQGGAVGDNVTDDGPVFIDALSFASFQEASNQTATNGVVVPPSDDPYYLGANTLELKKMVHFVGQSSGQGDVNPCRLRWDANITGIIVHRSNTIGATTETATTAGSASRIEGLHLDSGGGTIAAVTDDTKGHGIWLRARAQLIDLTIMNFPGNGINILATAGSGDPAREGNSNNWVIDGARIIDNHLSGIFVDGADVNAGSCKDADCSGNGRWGIWDSSFLGNIYIGCHTASNGFALEGENGAGESCHVEHSGNHYSANANASEADYVATTPGTDETIWYLEGTGSASGSVPAWAAAQPEGTYFHGGPYHSDNANARCVFTGCYAESNQAPSQFVANTHVFGGFMGSNKGTGIVHVGNTIVGSLDFPNHDTAAFAPDRDLTLQVNPSTDHLLKALAGSDHSKGMNVLSWDETNGQWLIGEHGNLSARRPVRITTDLNTETGGRSAALIGGRVLFNQGLWLGGGVLHLNNATAAATTGDRAKGEFDFNRNPAAGDPAGWFCTTGHASAPTFTALYGVGTQQSNIVDADVAHDINASFSDTEVEAKLDALGTKINSLIAAMEHFGFTAP